MKDRITKIRDPLISIISIMAMAGNIQIITMGSEAPRDRNIKSNAPLQKPLLSLKDQDALTNSPAGDIEIPLVIDQGLRKAIGKGRDGGKIPDAGQPLGGVEDLDGGRDLPLPGLAAIAADIDEVLVVGGDPRGEVVGAEGLDGIKVVPVLVEVVV